MGLKIPNSSLIYTSIGTWPNSEFIYVYLYCDYWNLETFQASTLYVRITLLGLRKNSNLSPMYEPPVSRLFIPFSPPSRSVIPSTIWAILQIVLTLVPSSSTFTFRQRLSVKFCDNYNRKERSKFLFL